MVELQTDSISPAAIYFCNITLCIKYIFKLNYVSFFILFYVGNSFASISYILCIIWRGPGRPQNVTKYTKYL